MNILVKIILTMTISLILSFHSCCGEAFEIVREKDVNEFYRLDTEYCNSKSKCGIPDTLPNCNCDDLCGIFDDCCSNIDVEKRFAGDKNSTRPEVERSYKRDQFVCETFHSQQQGPMSALMVSYCPKLWTDSETKQLCENRYSVNDSNILLKIPVSSFNSNITFRNMYCAYCNDIFEFKFWTFESVCINYNANDTCILFYPESMVTSHLRDCGDDAFSFISTCSKSNVLVSNQSHLHNLCEYESVLIVYDEKKNAYKNKFCALCNGHVERSLLCDYYREAKKIQWYDTYSYRLIVDFNLHRVKTVGTFKDSNADEASFKTCEDIHDEVYDPVSMKCRKLYCPPMLTAVEGKCLAISDAINNQQQYQQECPLVKLEKHEYEIQNSTSIYLFSSNTTIDSSQFLVNDSNVYMCYRLPYKNTLFNHLIILDKTESYMSLIGLICSIIALVITLLVYTLFSELRNLPGKNLISLMIALLLAQLLFISASQASDTACKVIAMCVHYFFLASFSWMNVIAFDLFVTFSQSRVLNSHKSRLFYKYSVYGWLLPAIIVISAVILEYSNHKDSTYRPRYGDTICLISSKNGLLLFLLGPLALFKFCDVVGFICTSFHISMSRRQSAIAKRYTFCSFLLYLKLSLIMGFTWLFAFIALFSDNAIIWYLFILFNTLQGVFIAISFLFTKRTKTLILAKIRNQWQNNRSASRVLQTTQNTTC